MANGRKTPDHFPEKPQDVLIDDSFAQNTEKDVMINRREEFPNVTFQHPDRFRPVTGRLPRECLEPTECAVRPLVDATRIRIGDEHSIEERVQNPMERAVDDPVADGRLMDITRLRVVHLERFVASVLV